MLVYRHSVSSQWQRLTSCYDAAITGPASRTKGRPRLEFMNPAVFEPRVSCTVAVTPSNVSLHLTLGSAEADNTHLSSYLRTYFPLMYVGLDLAGPVPHQVPPNPFSYEFRSVQIRDVTPSMQMTLSLSSLNLTCITEPCSSSIALARGPQRSPAMIWAGRKVNRRLPLPVPLSSVLSRRLAPGIICCSIEAKTIKISLEGLLKPKPKPKLQTGPHARIASPNQQVEQGLSGASIKASTWGYLGKV